MGAYWEYKLSRGEPKQQLFAQLFDIGRLEAEHRPRFSVDICRNAESNDRFRHEHKVGLLIEGIIAITGRGTLWRIEGWLHAGPRFLGEVREVNERFIGIYSTQKREGYLNFDRGQYRDIWVPPYMVEHG